MDKLRTIIKSSPFFIALIYVLVGALWIQYSDQIVLSLFDDLESITQAQSLKGWFYVLASGVLIFFLVYQSNLFIDNLLSDIEKSRDKFEATFEYAPLGIAHHKPNEKWILVNRSLCTLLGYSRSELLNLNFSDFIHPDDLERGRILDQDLIHGKNPSYKTKKKYRRKDGTYFIGRVTKAMVFDKEEKPLYLIAIVEDISQQKMNEDKLKESLEEKKVLLSEVHHRVKNNVALMSALLELQIMHSDNNMVVQILEHYKTRLKTLSLIYENFSEIDQEPNIDFKWYLHSQIEYLQHAFNTVEKNIEYQSDIKRIHLNVNQAIPVGLICNELLINANQHEFDNAKKPLVDISFYENDDSVIFSVKNNGVLKDSLFDLSDPQSLDSHIIAALVKQIEGSVSLTNEGNFHTYTLRFHKETWRGAASYIHPLT